MDQLLIGVLLALCGLTLCFFGLRLWYLLLPLIGAIIGFYIGARGLQEVSGDGFLATAISWFGGFVMAAGFAILSWFLWYAGVVLLAAALGALLVSGALHALMPDLWGWVLVIVALLAGLLGAVLAVTIDAPSYIIVVASAFVGAALAIVGIMTVFGTVTISELANGVAVTMVDEVVHQGASGLWILAWVVLGIAGIAVQWQRTSSIFLPEQHWVPVQTGKLTVTE
jgi:hypothetical protein